MQISSTAILEAMAAERFGDALEAAYARIDQNPDDQFALQIVARVRQIAGDDAGAEALLRPLVRHSEAEAPLLSEYGSVCVRLGDLDGAIHAFRRAVALDPGELAYLQNLAAVLQRAGRWQEAIPALQTMLARDPGNREPILLALRDAQTRIVPVWHFAMMNDAPRNQAYATAIEALVPGRRVLEIGTGAGLLAMIAARANAASVMTCEQVPLVADAARDVIERNGLSNEIRVIAKTSLMIDAERDLDGKADLLVTEIFSSDLLAERVLPALRHAREHLLTPNATIIPTAASAMGRLIGGAALRDKVWAESTLGFDVSPFGRFAPRRLQLDLAQQPHAALSEPQELLRLDFQTSLDTPQAHDIAFTVTQDDVCVGIGQWLRLDLSPDNVYENDPALIESSWHHVLHCLKRPIAVKRGDVVRARLTHDDFAINIEFVAQPDDPNARS